MALFAEHVPENHRAGFAFEIVDLQFLGAIDDFRVITARLTQSGQVTFDVGHKNRHAPRAEIFRQGLKGYGFPSASRAGDQSVAVRQFRQQTDFGFIAFGDENWISHC